MGKSDAKEFVFPNFRCNVSERLLGKLSRNARLLQKLNVKYIEVCSNYSKLRAQVSWLTSSKCCLSDAGYLERNPGLNR